MIAFLRKITMLMILLLFILLSGCENQNLSSENISETLKQSIIPKDSSKIQLAKELYPPFYNHLQLSFFVNDYRTFDNENVIMQNYDGKGYNEPGWQYSPTLIGQYILYCVRQTIGGENNKDTIEANANYLIRTAIHRKYNGQDFVVWKFDFPNPTFDAPSGWVSAMTNGICAAALLEASSLITDHSDEYKDIAIKAARAFEVPVSSGGVMSYIDEETYFFEEVAYPDAVQAHILNGNIYGILGLHAVAKEDPYIKDIYNKGIRGIIKLLDEYDAGFISLYDLKNRRLAPRNNYNFIHIQQLLFLYMETKDPTFLKYAVRFARYEKPAKFDIYDNNGIEIDSLFFGKKDFWKKAGTQQIKISFDTPQQVESIFVQSKYDYSGFTEYKLKASLGNDEFIPVTSFRKSSSGLDHAIIFKEKRSMDAISLEITPIYKELQIYGIDVLTKERKESPILIIYDINMPNNTKIFNSVQELEKYISNDKMIIIASDSFQNNVNISNKLEINDKQVIDINFSYDNSENKPSYWFGLEDGYSKEFIRVIMPVKE